MTLASPSIRAGQAALTPAGRQSISAFLRPPSEILFGEGMRCSIGWLSKQRGARAFVVIDPHLIGSDSLKDVVDALAQQGLATEVWDDVTPELPSELATRAADAARRWGADLVIAIGGGSCIDLAKVVATLVRHGGQLSDYYGEFAVPGPVLPIIAVPTTAGTGSEVTPVAVVTDSLLGTKVGLSSPHLIPHAAVCDPELTYSCPADVTASSGADALSHCIEAYTARDRSANPTLARDRVFVGRSALTDALALEGLTAIVEGLPSAFRDGANRQARARVMYGAMLAGLAFGTAGTAAAHALQYPVGARTHTPHGIGVGILLPYVMSYNLSHRTRELAVIARIFGADGPEAHIAGLAPGMVSDFLAEVGIPRRLKDIGIREEDAHDIAVQGLRAVRLSENNPRDLTADSARQIVTAAISGDMASLSPPDPPQAADGHQTKGSTL